MATWAQRRWAIKQSQKRRRAKMALARKAQKIIDRDATKRRVAIQAKEDYATTYAVVRLSEAVLQKWKLTKVQALMLLDLQRWACAICEVPFTSKPFVDHDHGTGQRRDLLCLHCNAGLGHFRDDPGRLGRAAIYLAKHTPAP
jgi:hypothetical protein